MSAAFQDVMSEQQQQEVDMMRVAAASWHPTTRGYRGSVCCTMSPTPQMQTLSSSTVGVQSWSPAEAHYGRCVRLTVGSKLISSWPVVTAGAVAMAGLHCMHSSVKREKGGGRETVTHSTGMCLRAGVCEIGSMLPSRNGIAANNHGQKQALFSS